MKKLKQARDDSVGSAPARTGAARRGAARLGAIGLLLAAVAWGRPARANQPFTLSADTTSGTPTAVSASGNNLIDLSDNLIQSKSQFSLLNGQAFNANLRYGGLANAFTYSQNASATASTLSIPSIGFTHKFTGADASDLRNNVRNYLEHQGAGVYAQFLQSVNRNTYLGVADGNPLATTALLADLSYEQFGLARPPSQPLAGDILNSEQLPGGLRVGLTGGYFDSRDGSGYYAQLTLTKDFRINDRVGLTIGGLANYRNEEDAQVYNVGGEVALPILVIPGNGDRSFSWQVTPNGLAGGSGSVELASGGLFYGLGATSSLAYRLDPFIVTLADQYTYFQGFPVSVGAYDFDTDVNQQLLKNGIMVTYALNANVGIEAGGTYTNFLNAARVRNYWSPLGALVFRLGDNGGIRINYEGDFAGGFRNNGGGIEFFFGY